MSELPTIPGYEAERLLGEGAYGRVYLARESEGLGRHVAIKLYTREGNADYTRELEALRKVEALRQEGAPGLVQSLATGEHEGQGFLVFEYLGAGSLADRIEAQGPLPVAEAVEVAVQVGKGLEALHEAGIWHRDVKPQNVLLGSDGKAKLADFGLARGVSGTLSAAGSPAFAAPEVIAGRPSDGPRADVYSLGATLIYAVTGATILPGRPDAFVLEQAGVPRPVQRVLLAATAADPEERLATVDGLLGVLESAHAESARLATEKLSETTRTESTEPDLESEPTPERTTDVPYTTSPAATADDYFMTATPTRTSKAAVLSLILALLVIPSAIGFAVAGVMFMNADRHERMDLERERVVLEQRIGSLKSELDWTTEGNVDALPGTVESVRADLEQAQNQLRNLEARSMRSPPADASGLALIGLLLIVGMEVAAIGLGIWALMAIGKLPELTGKGVAIGGLVVAGLNLLAVLCLVPMLFLSARSSAPMPMQPEAVVVERSAEPLPVAPRGPR